MGFNAGSFAGGLAGGLAFGINNGIHLADVIAERQRRNQIAAIQEQGMQEARTAREQAVNDLIREQGVTGDARPPASGPVSSAPSGQTPQEVSESSPTANPDAAAAKTAASYMAPQKITVTPSPTQNPDPAGAETAASAMPQGSQLSAQPDSPSVVQPTPQQATVSAGIKGNIPGQPGFWVNGQRYDTREQARAAAEKEAPSPIHFFMKTAVPKIAEQYMMAGDPEKAKAWLDHAESYNGKGAIKAWAEAFNAPDFDTAASRFGRYYTDYVDDGVDYTGHKMLTKDDGTQVAVVTLKDKATGKEQEMELTREKMLSLGAANNPQKLFEVEQAKQREADKLKFESALKARDRRMKLEDDMMLEDRKSANQDRRETLRQDRLDQRERIKVDMGVEATRGKQQSEIDTKIDALIGAGYGEDEIKKMMPAIVGAGEHKRTTDPTERRALIASDLMKNDPSFARKPREQQDKQINDMMGVIYGGEDKPQGKAASSVADKPIAYDPKLPIKYRKSDGKPFHYVDGQYVPIEGTVPPQAGGLPQR